MKKTILMITFLLGIFALSSAGVLADDQPVNGTVSPTISFSLIDTSLDFGAVASGGTSSVQPNRIMVNDINNVDFNLEISLIDDTLDNLFANIYLDLDENTVPETQIAKNPSTLTVPISDPVGNSTANHNFGAELRVPAGFPPGSGVGTIRYTFATP